MGSYLKSRSVTAFADDLLLISTGVEGTVVETEVNQALEIITNWGRLNKLNFAPQKTQTMLFTKKMKFHTPRLNMNGQPLLYCESMKILGLTLDRNLSFMKHIAQVSKRAVNLYKLISRTARAKFPTFPYPGYYPYHIRGSGGANHPVCSQCMGR
ncbi:jg21329 [Pararge aegeria aegeria]|uniref:Jg21329 protein n=1 Tax=Pararge aegeria aegeria TaxID=348720 RepID=A0A8S4QVM0_9NEOP|nr:jg21329 [Pararge aegeria aegeria]